MYLSGFSDESASDLATQIKVTKQLGWQNISIRNVDGVNIHEISDNKFNQCLNLLQDNNIKVPELGSLIGNWAKSIKDSFDITLAEVQRAIPRMQKMGCDMIRIMSYKQEPWGNDQYEQERFKRLRIITKMFNDAGLIVGHENCMNWGGFSAQHSLRLIEEVPDMKLIFDTGNPVFQRDRSQKQPYPWQSAWKFYKTVKEHIVHIQIKDCIMEGEEGEPRYVFAGKGDGDIEKILLDLKASNYDGGIAIEPHVATVFHMKADKVDWQQCYESYIQYGKSLEAILRKINFEF